MNEPTRRGFIAGGIAAIILPHMGVVEVLLQPMPLSPLHPWITPLGTAARITGQGTLATRASIRLQL